MLYSGVRKPIYVQFKEVLQQMIEEGKYKPGDLLPSERELAELYSISRVTVRQSLNALAQEGIVFKKQGKGTFVSTKRIETKLDFLLGFVEEFASKNMDCEVKVLKQGYESAPEDIAEAMGLKNDKEMFFLIRQIIVQGESLGLDYSYFPRSIARQFDQMDFSKIIVYQLLEQQGYKLISAEQTITAELPNPQDCNLLELNPKSPILVRCRLAYTEGNLPLAYSRALYKGDSYSYKLTLNRYSANNTYTQHTL